MSMGVPPHAAPSTEVSSLKRQLANTTNDIRGKNSKLTVKDLKRLLFRCAAKLISLDTVSRTLTYNGCIECSL
jgi:phosphatidylinositol 4-kinase